MSDQANGADTEAVKMMARYQELVMLGRRQGRYFGQKIIKSCDAAIEANKLIGDDANLFRTALLAEVLGALEAMFDRAPPEALHTMRQIVFETRLQTHIEAQQKASTENEPSILVVGSRS